MKVQVSAKVLQNLPAGTRVGVRVDAAWGGFTISNIWVEDAGGKQKIKYPLTAGHSPVVTLRGAIKQAVNGAVLRLLADGAPERVEEVDIPD